MPPPHTGDRSPLFVTLVDLLTRDFNLGDESHLVAHPMCSLGGQKTIRGRGGEVRVFMQGNNGSMASSFH